MQSVVKLSYLWSAGMPNPIHRIEMAEHPYHTLLFPNIGKRKEGIMKLLLGCQVVDPDPPGDDSRTPLSFAAEEGVGSVVTLLLECENVDPYLHSGRTPHLLLLVGDIRV